jgi:hypothetical protein
MDRQYNGQTKKKSNDLPSVTQNIKDLATRTSQLQSDVIINMD